MKIKKLVVALFVTVAVFVFGPKAIALPQGQGVLLLETPDLSPGFPDPTLDLGVSQEPIIKVVPFIGPEIPYSAYSSAFLNNAITGIRDPSLPSVGNPLNPAFWKPLIGNQVAPSQIVLTYGMNSWNGLLNPSGSFGGEYGNMLYFGYDIISSTPFSFNEISFSFESRQVTREGTFEDIGLGYAMQARGISWGADRIEGTVDDKILGPGDENVFANRITGIGFSYARSTDAESAAEMQAALASFLRDGPNPVTGGYSIHGLGYSAATLTVVPEPGTWAVLVLGVAYLALRKKKY